MGIEEIKEKNAYYEKIVGVTKTEFNPNDILFRCSGLFNLMVEPRSKSESISETTKSHLIDVFVQSKYFRREEISSKYLEKGNDCEDDSITILSRVSKKLFNKNKIRLSNDFISGEWDLDISEGHRILETIDTKSSWSANTFFRSKQEKLKPQYYWQGVGYMWLTGAAFHSVAYCLVNATGAIINDEKRKLSYKSGMLIDGCESEKFKEKCKQIEINMIFDLELFCKHNPDFIFHNNIENWVFDIPKEERVFIQRFERKESDIDSLKEKINTSRNFIREFINT